MAVSISLVARLRRMVSDLSGEAFTNADLEAAIERYPTADELGERPYTLDRTTVPPTQEANASWIPTYDLHASAADLWEQKAAALAENYDFSDSQASYRRSQAYDMAMKQVRYHRSRSCPKSVSAASLKGDDPPVWIANLPETEE